MKYVIEHWPKFKTQELAKLSVDQQQIRINSKLLKHKETRTCNRCNKEQPITEFYEKKERQTRDTTCRDCRLRAAGVKEVGKRRFSDRILTKGFRRCTICKDIKPLTLFTKSKNVYAGHSNACYSCQHNLTKAYVQKQKKKVGLFHIRQYALRNYGDIPLDESTVRRLKKEILQKRKPKHYFDGLSFMSSRMFAKYIEKTYGINSYAVEARLKSGYKEDDCIIPEHEFRSKAYTKGEIKVTDLVTGEILFFSSTQDKRLTDMFSGSAIVRCIQTGEPTRVKPNSKYKNPCTIERL